MQPTSIIMALQDNKHNDNNNVGRRELRVRGIGNSKFQELKNVCNYYSIDASAFVRKLIIDYLESCPDHMKSTPLIDKA